MKTHRGERLFTHFFPQLKFPHIQPSNKVDANLMIFHWN